MNDRADKVALDAHVVLDHASLQALAADIDSDLIALLDIALHVGHTQRAVSA